MKMFSIICLLAGLFLVSQIALADSKDGFAGHYEGPVDGGKGELEIKANKDGSLNIEFVIQSANCSGEISGAAKKADNDFVLTQKQDGDDESCEITFSFSKKTLKTKETSCKSYRGASCTFSSYKGVFTKK